MDKSLRIMLNLQGKRILFFTASFLGFQYDIKNALELMGAEVDWFDERVSDNTLIKAIVRVKRDALAIKINSYYDNIIIKTKNVHYDYIFFVNIEAATRNIIEKLKRHQPNAKFILYEWDSIDNNHNAKDLLDLFDESWTFDKKDSEKYKMNFLPLFYNNEYVKINKHKNYKYEVMFVGTTHSNRYQFAKSIEDQIDGEKYNWFYFPSRLLYIKMWLQDKYFRKHSRMSEFRFKVLPKKELLSIIESSKIMIDAQHPKQTGLTMRTLEALGARRKLITTNSKVKEYDFYNSSNILVVDRNNPEIPKSFVDCEYEDLPFNIYNKYSLNSWLKNIFHE